ncbi:MAG: DUF4203 domain-containing protein [Phycisphaeraceae bacterium]
MDPNSAAIDPSTLPGDLPAIGQSVLIAAVLLGVGLWLMGMRLARPACAVSGLVLGGLVAAAVAQEAGNSQYVLFFLIAGAITCGLVAWLLFRVWMGLSGALLLALVFSIAALAAQGSGLPPQANTDALMIDPAEIVGGEAINQLWQNLKTVYEQQKTDMGVWWDGLGGSGRMSVIVVGIGGAVGGLLLGLILPYLAASFQSALVGAVLIVYGGLPLIAANAPQMYSSLPTTTRLRLLTVGLITILGVAIQWTLFKHKADT